MRPKPLAVMGSITLVIISIGVIMFMSTTPQHSFTVQVAEVAERGARHCC